MIPKKRSYLTWPVNHTHTFPHCGAEFRLSFSVLARSICSNVKPFWQRRPDGINLSFYQIWTVEADQQYWRTLEKIIFHAVILP